MKAKPDKSMDAFIKSLAKTAVRTNAGVALVSFKNCAAYEDGSVFVVFAAKGADRFEVADALFDSLKEDDK